MRVEDLAASPCGLTDPVVELLRAHAVARCLGLRAELGVRVLLADALNEKAADFYRAYGFRPTTARALTLYLPLGKP